jgi:osmoprotectant transport system permease protein
VRPRIASLLSGLFGYFLCFFGPLSTPSAVLAQAPEVGIGSKSFTESVILGELLSHLAKNAGAQAQHRAELGGTQRRTRCV